MALTLAELVGHVGGMVRGDTHCLIAGVATLEKARAGELSFLAQPRYRKYLAATQASAVIVSAEEAPYCPVTAWITDNPSVTYARAAALLYPPSAPVAGVHPSACVSAQSSIHESAAIGPHCVIEAGVHIGAHVQIGPGCVIGAGVVIGAHSRLLAHVTVCHATQIGQRALIHPGVVIGSDGFGLANEKGVWVKIPQLGRVCIGDDVEIGANTTIDRGALDDTVLEDGVKLDNQIQVAHNVRIGAHTAIAGCVGIAGSAKIGKRCMIGGGVGIAGHLEIADDVQITGMTLVSKSITEPGLYSSGVPAQPNALWNKNYARLRQLDELARRLHALEKKFDN